MKVSIILKTATQNGYHIFFLLSQNINAFQMNAYKKRIKNINIIYY